MMSMSLQLTAAGWRDSGKQVPGSPDYLISKFCRSADLYVRHDIKICMSARLNGTVGRQKKVH